MFYLFSFELNGKIDATCDCLVTAATAGGHLT